MGIKMNKQAKHENAKEIARDVIDIAGSDPDYMSVIEAIDEFLSVRDEIENISDEEYELFINKFAPLVEKYIKNAIITIEFPDFNKEKK